MKICVVTARWSITGVPLAQRRFALALAAAGHDVDLIMGFKDAQLNIPATPGLNLILWNAPGVRNMVVPLITYLKSVKPDIVFSAEDHLNGAVIVAAILAGSKAKISGSSRVGPANSYSNRIFSMGWLRKLAMSAVMFRADALTCVSKDMAIAYQEYFPVGQHKAVYNVIDDESSRFRASAPVDHEWFLKRDLPIIVSAGTLDTRKNFKLLINSIVELKRRGRYVRLAIFGEGHCRSELEELIYKNEISDRTWLPGKIDNPLAFFAHADVLALSSYAEGLPNVLVEGMICGCTPVSTDCPTGPREVIEGSGVGYLVPIDDVPAMADAIELAIDNPASRTDLQRATAPFRQDVVVAQHFALLGFSPTASAAYLC